MVPADNARDAYTPGQMAQLVSGVGVRKAKIPLLQLWMPGLLAGAFIAFGAMFFTLVMTGNHLGFGLGRTLGGLAFSLGLVLVIVGGAELFTGNNLIVMAWADSRSCGPTIQIPILPRVIMISLRIEVALGCETSNWEMD